MKLLSIGMALVFTLGCGDKGAEPAAPTSRRAAAVKAEKSAGPINDQAGFCEKAYPKSGPEARPFTWPPQRPLPGKEVAEAPQAAGGWTYLNVWATWCAPCLAEMGLLGRWSQAINQEGSPLALELLTIDVPAAAEDVQKRIDAGLPGRVRWLRDEADFGPFLDGLGVDRNAAIPIHALIDPQGMLRCVRVGAISGQDYAAVKAILAGG